MSDPIFDRMIHSMAAIVRSILPNIDLLAHYACTVNGQNSDGTLELTPDDTRIGSHSKIPIKYGEPGIVATVSGGARG